MFKEGTFVKQDGYTGVFEVVGEWRGYAVLLSSAGTEHKAPLSELTAAETCRCGMWPVEEYGPECPSCKL